MLSIAKLTLDLEPVLQGVDRMPVIGWEIESHNRNVKQVSYWLQISPDENFSTVIFDSGKVNSETSNNLDVGEISLQPSTRYFVRVQVQDNHGQTSDWCSAAYFITGLLNSGWQAEFISAETPADKKSSATTSLRKSFAINNAGDIVFAVLHVSALGLYEFHLNGQKVGNDELTPGWTSYHHHLLYQTYDLTGLLQSGENVMGAILGAGWFKGDMGFTRDRNYYGEQTALICQLVIHYNDGKKDIIYSDSGWQGNDSPILFS